MNQAPSAVLWRFSGLTDIKCRMWLHKNISFRILLCKWQSIQIVLAQIASLKLKRQIWCFSRWRSTTRSWIGQDISKFFIRRLSFERASLKTSKEKGYSTRNIYNYNIFMVKRPFEIHSLTFRQVFRFNKPLQLRDTRE